MNEPLQVPTGDKSSRLWILVWAVLAGVGLVAGSLTVLFFYLRVPNGVEPASEIVQVGDGAVAAASAAQQAEATRGYSTTNVVSVLLGQEGPEDGIRHLAEERDGRTTIETVDGMPCRYLNRRKDQKGNGFLYFAIHPDFKMEDLKTARIEVEFRAVTGGYLRLQYDGMEGETHKPYKSAMPIDEKPVTLGTGTRFIRFQETNEWRTASFQVTDGVFMNSENGGADFRMEIFPPEIYVRRVSVTREGGKPLVPPPDR
jgi:hypothetical protein